MLMEWYGDLGAKFCFDEPGEDLCFDTARRLGFYCLDTNI